MLEIAKRIYFSFQVQAQNKTHNKKVTIITTVRVRTIE